MPEFYVTYRFKGNELKSYSIETEFDRVQRLRRVNKIDGYMLAWNPEKDHSEILGMDLRKLPWPRRAGTWARNALGAYFKQQRGVNYDATVADVQSLYRDHARKRKPLVILNYGVGAHKATQKVLARLGIELPKVEVSSKI